MSIKTIVNGTLVQQTEVVQADLVIEHGVISEIRPSGSRDTKGEVIDATGLLVMPGAIDIHFHCRAPGYPERGDFATETRAAAAGGVTTIFEMPISKPGTATAAVLENRRALGERDAYVNFGLYAAPASLNPREIEAMVAAGAIGFKTFMTATPEGREAEFDGLCAVREDEIYQVLELTKPYAIPAVFHSESNNLLNLFQGRVITNDAYPPDQHASSRPPVVESTAIAMLIALVSDVGRHAHVAHLSTAAGLDFIRDAQRRGVPITAETCPHYLVHTSEILREAGPFAVINPPLRSESDRTALWAGLDDGTIDVITTDHSTSTAAEKDQGWEDARLAPPGTPSVEFLYPFVIDQALRGRFTLQRAVELVAGTPARLFNLPEKGTIREGADADLILCDPNTNQIVDRAHWHSKAAPVDRLYTGMKLQGKIIQTLVRGELVAKDNVIVGESGYGCFVQPHL